MAVSFVICLHSDQFFAIFGAGEHAARWAIRLKEPHLSVAYLVALFGSIGVSWGCPTPRSYGAACRRKQADDRRRSSTRGLR